MTSVWGGDICYVFCYGVDLHYKMSWRGGGAAQKTSLHPSGIQPIALPTELLPPAPLVPIITTFVIDLSII